MKRKRGTRYAGPGVPQPTRAERLEMKKTILRDVKSQVVLQSGLELLTVVGELKAYFAQRVGLHRLRAAERRLR